PLDLTQDALRQRGISVDTDAFSAAMERQKAEARANWAGSGEAATETVWFAIRDQVGATEFLGYDTEAAEGVIAAIVKAGTRVDGASEGDEVAIVVNQTPFYAESGGQVGDTGRILGEGFAVDVTDTQKKADGLFVHFGRVISGTATSGATVELKVDAARRARIRRNHSATHLIHEALREVLGTHVAQKGSLVAPDRLRFDFSHPKPIAADELARIEELSNEIVLQNAPVTTRLMAVDDAIAEGAMALFGEKYGDEVRVVSIGMALHGDKAGKSYSTELCGGTHVSATGDIGIIRLLAEGAVASGVRRIEALTGEAARQHLDEQDKRLKAAAAALKVAPADVVTRLEAVLDERKKLERELSDARKKLALGGGAGPAGAQEPETVAGIGFLGRIVPGVSARDLKPLADEGKSSVGSGVVVFVGTDDGKASVVVGVTDDLTARYSAVDLVRAAAAAIGGKGGGGRPDMAQAGGPDAANADAAIAAVREALAG
ncbi:MAG: alanine--tRNA ligase-related protein, partial [Aliihoeflea sp.]